MSNHIVRGLLIAFFFNLCGAATFSQTRQTGGEIQDGGQAPYSTVFWMRVDSLDTFITALANSSLFQAFQSTPASQIVDDFVQSWSDEQKDWLDLDRGDVLRGEGLRGEGLLAQLRSLFGQGGLELAIFHDENLQHQFLISISIDERHRLAERALENLKSEEHRDRLGIQVIDAERGLFGVDQVRICVRPSEWILASSVEAIENWIDEPSGTSTKEKRRLRDNRKFQRIHQHAEFGKSSVSLKLYVDLGHLIRAQLTGNSRSKELLQSVQATGVLDLLCGGGKWVFPDETSRAPGPETEWYVDFHVLIAEPRIGLTKVLSFKPVSENRFKLVPEEVDFCLVVNSDLMAIKAGLEDLMQVAEKQGVSRDRVMVGLSQVAPMITLPMMLGNDFDQFDGHALFFGNTTDEKNLDRYDFTLHMGTQPNQAQRLMDAFVRLAGSGPGPGITKKQAHDIEYWTIADDAYEAQQRRQQEIAQAHEREIPDGAMRRMGFTAREDGIYIFSSIESMISYLSPDSDSTYRPLNDRPSFRQLIRQIEVVSGSDQMDSLIYFSPGQLYRTPYFRLLRWLDRQAYFEEYRRTQGNLATDPAERSFPQKLDAAAVKHHGDWPSFKEWKQHFGPSGGAVTDSPSGLRLTFFQLKRGE